MGEVVGGFVFRRLFVAGVVVPFDEVRGNVLEKFGGVAGFGLAVAGAHARIRDGELVARAGEGDIEEATLFFDAMRRGKGFCVRQDTMLTAGKIDAGEFEAFAGVNGHDGDLAVL